MASAHDLDIAHPVIPHRRPAGTPDLRATVTVLATADALVRVILPSSCRLDPAKVCEVLGVREVHPADGRELLFEAVDHVLVDIRVCAADAVVIDELRLPTSELLELADAQIAELCLD